MRKRAADQIYLASLLTEPREVSCLNGQVVQAAKGDVVIAYDNGVAIEVMSAPEYERTYAICEQPSGLALSADGLSRLAKVLRMGATNSERDFVSSVEALASVQIGEVHVDFTQAQVAELKLRADKRHLPYEAYVKLVVDAIMQDFWIAKM